MVCCVGKVCQTCCWNYPITSIFYFAWTAGKIEFQLPFVMVLEYFITSFLALDLEIGMINSILSSRGVSWMAMASWTNIFSNSSGDSLLQIVFLKVIKSVMWNCLLYFVLTSSIIFWYSIIPKLEAPAFMGNTVQINKLIAI